MSRPLMEKIGSETNLGLHKSMGPDEMVLREAACEVVVVWWSS